MTKVLEFYGVSTRSTVEPDWNTIVEQEQCPYLQRACLKTRKSQPLITIGTCSMIYGKEQKDIIICPHRLLERRQIFLDCIHLLTLHEPGNELHVVSGVGIPGGSVDYVLVSVRNKEVRDFVGIELQTLDTTGTVWPNRQRFLQSQGMTRPEEGFSMDPDKNFGINWKMTAKTILMQLHHKVLTFEEINKHLTLVVQDHFADYIQKTFRLSHLSNARIGDSTHVHVYHLMQQKESGSFRLELDIRLSTDADGIARGLGLQTSHKVELEQFTRLLAAKISAKTLLQLL